MLLIKSIVFLKDNTGAFKLRGDVKPPSFDVKSGQYKIRFNKGEKYFHYKPENVDIAVFKRQLEPPFRITRKEDGEVFHRVLGVRVFEGKYNTAYSITFESGKTNEYPSDYLYVEEHIDDYRSISVWDYLNQVAKYNKIPVDDDKTISLSDKYDKLGFVAKGTLLEAYLNVDVYPKVSRDSRAPIFPFGCNRSQYKAVRNALDNKMSVIQGPPGTGKTQTILNILANLLLDDKTMEIVSNNNSAVENVKEKLDANGLGFICAQLGRASNKKEFIDAQTGEYPDMDGWIQPNAGKLRKEAIELSRELQQKYESQELLASCSERLSEYRKQLALFPKTVETRRRWSIKTLEKYYLLTSCELEQRHKLSWWTRFRLRWRHLPATEEAPDEIKYLLVTTKIKNLELLHKKYSSYTKDADDKNERLRKISMLVLKDHLCRKYGSSKERRVFSLDEIYCHSLDFLREYPVVLSTTFSATSNINQAVKFDYLIMDEASQVDIAAGALALNCARNAVIVGDLKQLPNVVDSHTEEIVSAIFAGFSIAEAYRYSNHSFLSSLCELYPQIPQTLLREHYRCDPLIIGFCSKQFYNGELIPMKRTATEFAPIRVIRTCPGNHQRGNHNDRQVDTIIEEALPVLEEQFSDIGIIAPYNDQVQALHAALKETGREYVAATVHKFQGRENDAIVLSTVDNQIREFTDDPHLLNVAVSRAKKQFTLIVSADKQPDSNIQALIDYIEYYCGKSEQGAISSIYDLLYEDYTQDLLEFYKTHKRVAQYDSENLTYYLIQDVLKENGYIHLGVEMHYKLRHLITSASNLTPEERAYASRSWTHVDFLIYDKVTHKPKLAIEVDGTQFHKSDSEQGHRDSLKDSVLEAIGLPLLRLSTSGSQEKEKIARRLLDIKRGSAGSVGLSGTV